MINIHNMKISNFGTGLKMEHDVDVYMSGVEIRECGKAIHIVNGNGHHDEVPLANNGRFRLSPAASAVKNYLFK